MAAMLGVASSRVVRSFEIQVAKATNGQKNGSAEESISIYLYFYVSSTTSDLVFTVFGLTPSATGKNPGLNKVKCHLSLKPKFY